MLREESLSDRAARLAKRLRTRAHKLRKLAETLEQNACALQCAAMLEDEAAFAELEAWARGRHSLPR